MAFFGWLAGTKVGRAVVAGFSVMVMLAIMFWRVFSAGKRKAEAEQDEASLENLRERAKNDAEIESLPAAERDERLDRWVRD